MSGAANRRAWRVPATAEAISGLRGTVVQAAAASGVPDPPLSQLRLALSEAMTNAVLHAFRHRGVPGTIEVELAVEPDRRLRVRVVDDGDGVAPRDDSPGIGLGMPLIADLAESFDVRSRPEVEGTEVIMTFRLEPAAGTAA